MKVKWNIQATTPQKLKLLDDWITRLKAYKSHLAAEKSAEIQQEIEQMESVAAKLRARKPYEITNQKQYMSDEYTIPIFRLQDEGA